MCAVDYIQTMVNANDAIYIDTASLMEISSLELFIENAEDIFYQTQRKIIVPNAVCLELARHMRSQNSDKREKAFRALELIRAHEDMFDLKSGNLREEKAFKAFADSELLAELILNKADCGQLLITNDKRLSEDAFSLNRQASCHGHKIMVCFLNGHGELRKCECCRFTDKPRATKISTNNSASHDKKVDFTNISTKPVKENHLILSTVIPVGTFIAGVLTEKYGKTAVKFIATAFLRRTIRL